MRYVAICCDLTKKNATYRYISRDTVVIFFNYLNNFLTLWIFILKFIHVTNPLGGFNIPKYLGPDLGLYLLNLLKFMKLLLKYSEYFHKQGCISVTTYMKNVKLCGPSMG